MQNSNSFNQPSLRFRRWSRKSFASFLSLGRHVLIGHVKPSIADASCTKSNYSNDQLLKCAPLLPTDPLLLEEEEILLETITIFPILIPVLNSNSETASAHENIYTHKKRLNPLLRALKLKQRIQTLL